MCVLCYFFVVTFFSTTLVEGTIKEQTKGFQVFVCLFGKLIFISESMYYLLFKAQFISFPFLTGILSQQSSKNKNKNFFLNVRRG